MHEEVHEQQLGIVEQHTVGPNTNTEHRIVHNTCLFVQTRTTIGESKVNMNESGPFVMTTNAFPCF